MFEFVLSELELNTRAQNTGMLSALAAKFVVFVWYVLVLPGTLPIETAPLLEKAAADEAAKTHFIVPALASDEKLCTLLIWTCAEIPVKPAVEVQY